MLRVWQKDQEWQTPIWGTEFDSSLLLMKPDVGPVPVLPELCLSHLPHKVHDAGERKAIASHFEIS